MHLRWGRFCCYVLLCSTLARAGLTKEYDKFDDRGRVVLSLNRLVIDATIEGEPGKGVVSLLTLTATGPSALTRVTFLLDESLPTQSRVTLNVTGGDGNLGAEQINALATAKSAAFAITTDDAADRPTYTLTAKDLADLREFARLTGLATVPIDPPTSQPADPATTQPSPTRPSSPPASKPPAPKIATEPPPQLVIYLIDASGSMLSQRRAVETEATRLFETLRPRDRFNVISFAQGARSLSDKLLSVNPESRKTAALFVHDAGASGQNGGFSDAIDIAVSVRPTRIVLLTDGDFSDVKQVEATFDKLAGLTKRTRLKLEVAWFTSDAPGTLLDANDRAFKAAAEKANADIRFIQPQR